MKSSVRAFPIPAEWEDSPDHTISVEMPPFTKVISVGYDKDKALVAWGVVRDGWDNGGGGFTFQIRKPEEELGSGNFDAQFIEMVDIDGEPHAVFLGGIAK